VSWHFAKFGITVISKMFDESTDKWMMLLYEVIWTAGL